ncbi:MAG: cobalamin-dependent protein [Actinobacteria bacterium]|nr:cobalamin-dependent protein [Actinomycetota bacterium]
MPPDAQLLTLRACAQRLGVHYMTVYRYVRTGILPAVKEGSEWRVAAADLESFRSGPAAPLAPGDGKWSQRLKARMMAGDERGSWQVAEAAMASGLLPEKVYLDVLAPALHSIGDGWADGSVTVAEEHRASVVADRLIGRLGSRFATRGRPRGRIVLGTPPGEHHRLPGAMVADILRAGGYEVLDLGVDVPVDSFVEAVAQAAPVAVGISVGCTDLLPAVAEVTAALRHATAAPILVGGPAVSDAAHAASLGADAYAADGAEAVLRLGELAG